MEADRSRSPYGHQGAQLPNMQAMGFNPMGGAMPHPGGMPMQPMHQGYAQPQFQPRPMGMGMGMGGKGMGGKGMGGMGGPMWQNGGLHPSQQQHQMKFNLHLAGQPGAMAQQAPPVPPPAVVPPPPPVPQQETQEEAEAREKREAKEAAERLRLAVERNEGYFEPKLGQVLEASGDAPSRYVNVGSSPLGVGVFSAVWPCADKDHKLVALKVVRHQDHFRKHAEKEVQILQRCRELEEMDKEGSSQVAMLLEHFVLKAGEHEHLCMVFEKLENNLRALGRQPLGKVLQFSKQILLALRFLHDVAGFVHCDVKPDNLLLRWDGLSVKLCDFGTARLSPELQEVDELQPLFYRAPEVYMGATRGRKIDVWSAGCTIYELVVGRIFFKTCNTHREVVQKIQEHCGPIPPAVREQGRLTKLYFSSKGFHPEVGDPVDPDKAYKKKPMITEMMAFADLGSAGKQSAHEQAKAQLAKLMGRTTVVGAAMKRSGGPTDDERKLKALADLVERCMDVDPSARISAADACQHEAIKEVELPPNVGLQEAPPLPSEEAPPLPPQEPAPPPA